MAWMRRYDLYFILRSAENDSKQKINISRTWPMRSGLVIKRSFIRQTLQILGIYACLTLMCAVPVLALDRDQSLSQLYHTSWTARDGVNGSVVAIAQTSDGYLWVGTTDGLLRFDGVSFEHYKPEVGSFFSSSVSALLALPDGGLWIGYLRGG